MSLVKMGKQWEINSREDYDKAIEILDGNEFCAKMSDDYNCERRELAEIDRQRNDVNKQAKDKGII